MNAMNAHAGRRVGAAGLFAALALTGALTLWFGQDSFNAWWLQTWHQRSPLERLNACPQWRSAAALRARLQAWHDGPASMEQAVAAGLAADSTANEVSPEAPGIPELPPAPEAPQTPDAPPESPAPPVIRLAAADKVLFVGDSMMQSIAPLLQRTLLREGGIRSINLSRHSTGLTNAAYFNWPQAVEAALRQHPDTRLVVVFLGANDPWDFFESRSRKRFGTPEWDEAYAARALRITRAARQAGASVIWIGLPLMRANDYGQRIRRLNAVLAQNLDAAALWLPTEELLGDGTPSYADSIRLEGKLTRVRHADGIHLALPGQRRLASHVRQFIEYAPAAAPKADAKTSAEAAARPPAMPPNPAPAL